MSDEIAVTEYPDEYLELQMTSRVDECDVPMLKVGRIKARLEDGVYRHQRSHKDFPESKLLCLELSARGSNPCRWIKCREADMDRAILIMRTDLLKEVRTLADDYAKMVDIFHKAPQIVGDDKCL